MEVTTAHTDTVSVHVFTPPGVTPPIDVTGQVTIGVPFTHDIPPELIVPTPFGSINSIRVEANKEVAVNVLTEGSCSGYLTLPFANLGNEYYVLTWDPEIAGVGKSRISVSAGNQRTVVQFFFPAGISIQNGPTTYDINNPLEWTLEPYGSFQMLHSQRLSGLHIVADQIIACFGGNTNVIIGSDSPELFKDSVNMQYTPVKSWGRTFHIVPPPNDLLGGILLIVASRDGTAVQTIGDDRVLNAGDVTEMALTPSAPLTVTANQPVMAVYFTKSSFSSQQQFTPSATLLTPMEQYLDNYIFSTLTITGRPSDDYVLIAIMSNATSSLRLDSSVIAQQAWEQIPGSSYVAQQIPITTGNHQLSLLNSVSAFGAVVFGNIDRFCTYSYPAGTGLAVINEVS